uniref:Uncharacterized protein n=1 Tax=Romanomermis culicivorax TaxID=13658 RepID=A0A915JT49_ROMCU
MPYITTNFPEPQAVRKTYPGLHPKDAKCPGQIILAFRTTYQMIITTTRSHGTKCHAHRTAKK